MIFKDCRVPHSGWALYRQFECGVLLRCWLFWERDTESCRIKRVAYIILCTIEHLSILQNTLTHFFIFHESCNVKVGGWCVGDDVTLSRFHFPGCKLVMGTEQTNKPILGQQPQFGGEFLYGKISEPTSTSGPKRKKVKPLIQVSRKMQGSSTMKQKRRCFEMQICYVCGNILIQTCSIYLYIGRGRSNRNIYFSKSIVT